MSEYSKRRSEHFASIGTATADKLIPRTYELTFEQAQTWINLWMAATFAPKFVEDPEERGCRFFEEAAELVQAHGMERAQAHRIVDYVFDRPKGDLFQEVGGMLITAFALSAAERVDVAMALRLELVRVFGNVDKIRTKRLAKPEDICGGKAPEPFG